ncbi:MAG TPA: hypothetical protein VNI52_10225 [Sphingobacteriaceae bacterium]|nr:hypothetical protein [Sphingobacteriaceae bacterium]
MRERSLNDFNLSKKAPYPDGPGQAQVDNNDLSGVYRTEKRSR